MKWNVVYRKNASGVWQAVAFFLIHADGKDYVDRMNILEPRRYRAVVESRDF